MLLHISLHAAVILRHRGGFLIVIFYEPEAETVVLNPCTLVRWTDCLTGFYAQMTTADCRASLIGIMSPDKKKSSFKSNIPFRKYCSPHVSVMSLIIHLGSQWCTLCSIRVLDQTSFVKTILHVRLSHWTCHQSVVTQYSPPYLCLLQNTYVHGVYPVHFPTKFAYIYASHCVKWSLWGSNQTVSRGLIFS